MEEQGGKVSEQRVAGDGDLVRVTWEVVDLEVMPSLADKGLDVVVEGVGVRWVMGGCWSKEDGVASNKRDTPKGSQSYLKNY